MIKYCGLDVHKKVVEACVLDAAGAVIFRQRFTLTPQALVQFCKDQLTPESRVVLEATSNTWAVVALLRPHVAQVVVSNPMQTKAIAQAKVKTDKVDALILAQLLRCDFLPAVWQPDEATQRRRRLTRRRAALVGMRTAVKNRLHALFAQRLLTPPADLFSAAGFAWVQNVPLDDDGDLARHGDLRLLDAIDRELALLDGVLAKLGHADQETKLLMTLPGVDVNVALAVRGALGDVSRFRDGEHAAAYLGLAPSVKQSADKCYRGPITKEGCAQARWLLVQAAQHVAKHPGPLGHFFRRLAKKKNRNVAVVATARKLVVLAWHLLTKKEPYRYAQPAATERKLQKLRVRATGQKRKTGPKDGAFAKAKCQPGVKTRTIKALPAVLTDEELPAPSPAPAAETRVLTAAGLAGYAASLGREQVIVKNGKPRARSRTPATPAEAPGTTTR
jgi:transposase